MKDINRLAGQTLIYGLGTIVPRFLHYFVLTFYYTRVFADSEYGVVTELYAYMVLLLVVLTYGMETGFFRFSNSRENKDEVYSTAIISLLVSSLVFLILSYIFIGPISRILLYKDNPEYIRYFIAIIAVDAFTAIPFAKLRLDNRPMKFSMIKLINVLVTILLVLFYFEIGPWLVIRGKVLPLWLFDPDRGVGYVFIANLFASIVCLILLIPEIVVVRPVFRTAIWKRMIIYSFPLLIAGMAGSINDALDKMILKRLAPGGDGLGEVGQYGASYKLAVLMALFIQMFRFAVEPYFFEKAGKEDAKSSYALVMKYFIIYCLIIYLGINLYISGFKYFLGPELREGLSIVPIVSMGYLLFGIFVNLSVWYKVNDLTKFGAILAIGGAIITVAINVIFVPKIGYIASAWAHIACYGTMVLGSYFLGRKYYKIPYETGKILIYIFGAIALVLVTGRINFGNILIELTVNTLLIGMFIIVIQRKEKAISIFFNEKEIIEDETEN